MENTENDGLKALDSATTICDGLNCKISYVLGKQHSDGNIKESLNNQVTVYYEESPNIQIIPVPLFSTMALMNDNALLIRQRSDKGKIISHNARPVGTKENEHTTNSKSACVTMIIRFFRGIWYSLRTLIS